MEEQRVAPLERRDLLLGLGAVAALTFLSWLALLRIAGAMRAPDPMAAMGMVSASPWSGADLLQACLMWAVMMAAMMLPSTLPMVLLYARLSRQRVTHGQPALHVVTLLGGYLAVWAGFSVLAALAQGALQSLALLTPGLALSGPWPAALLLLGAAAYQWSPPKAACLRLCRSPLSLFIAEWREGWAGTLRLGALHGATCVGCCWLLMLLLFVAGVMNLAWVGLLAALVLLERALPHGAWVGRAAGVGFVAWAAWLVLR